MTEAATGASHRGAATAPGAAYSYLGPAGTFTWEALEQVPAARDAPRRSVRNVGEALDDVVAGRSTAAMIAIENSVDGGVGATQDALARIPDLRILGEYLVPVAFALVARPGTALDDVRVVAAHPVAYAQCRLWLERRVPEHTHVPAASNVAAADDLQRGGFADAAIVPPGVAARDDVRLLAPGIGDNPDAVTRFVLVGRSQVAPARTGADKTTVIVELPSDRPGTLLEMLELFSTRGINMSLIQSRPVGDALGRYRFVVDLDGHILDERVADALMGLKRFSPNVVYLGSYPRADRMPVESPDRYGDEAFVDARDWVRGLISGEPQHG